MVFVALAGSSIQLVPDGTLLLNIAIIAIMVAVLNRTLFKPINKILADREMNTAGKLAEARKTLATVDERLSHFERELRQARSEAYRMIERQRLAALREREERLVLVKGELQSWAAREKEAIEEQAANAKADLEREARRSATLIASRVLHRPVA